MKFFQQLYKPCSKDPGKTPDMILNPTLWLLSETLSFPKQVDNWITSNSTNNDIRFDWVCQWNKTKRIVQDRATAFSFQTKLNTIIKINMLHLASLPNKHAKAAKK